MSGAHAEKLECVKFVSVWPATDPSNTQWQSDLSTAYNPGRLLLAERGKLEHGARATASPLPSTRPPAIYAIRVAAQFGRRSSAASAVMPAGQADKLFMDGERCEPCRQTMLDMRAYNSSVPHCLASGA